MLKIREPAAYIPVVERYGVQRVPALECTGLAEAAGPVNPEAPPSYNSI
jgi:hypothetical protein